MCQRVHRPSASLSISSSMRAFVRRLASRMSMQVKLTRNTKREEKSTTKNTIKVGINEIRKKLQRGPKNIKQSIKKKSKLRLKYIVKRPGQESSHVHVDENIVDAFDLKFWSFWAESALNVVSKIREPYKSIISTETVRKIARKLAILEPSIYTSVNFPWKKRRENIRFSAPTAMSSKPGR